MYFTNSSLHRTATHCNTLQRTATHYNALQHTATHCNALQHTATHCNALQHTATHCNTLQRTATHCNALQHNINPLTSGGFLFWWFPNQEPRGRGPPLINNYFSGVVLFIRDLDLETTQKGNSLGGEGFLPKGNPPGGKGFLSIDMLCIYICVNVFIPLTCTHTHVHLHTRTSTHTYIYTHVHLEQNFPIPQPTTGWRQQIGCLIFIGHILQKSPIISGCFAKNDQLLKASYGSLPNCTGIFTA